MWTQLEWHYRVFSSCPERGGMIDFSQGGGGSFWVGNPREEKGTLGKQATWPFWQVKYASKYVLFFLAGKGKCTVQACDRWINNIAAERNILQLGWLSHLTESVAGALFLSCVMIPILQLSPVGMCSLRDSQTGCPCYQTNILSSVWLAFRLYSYRYSRANGVFVSLGCHGMTERPSGVSGVSISQNKSAS